MHPHFMINISLSRYLKAVFRSPPYMTPRFDLLIQHPYLFAQTKSSSIWNWKKSLKWFFFFCRARRFASSRLDCQLKMRKITVIWCKRDHKHRSLYCAYVSTSQTDLFFINKVSLEGIAPCLTLGRGSTPAIHKFGWPDLFLNPFI